MNLTVTVLEIVAPVFLLAGIGFAWVRLGLEYRLEFVTRLAMTMAVPCLIFVSLMQSDIDPQSMTSLLGAGLVAYGMITVATLALVFALRLDPRTFITPLTFGNTGNLGLPLALFAFGEIGLSYAVVLFAIMAVWNFTYGVWVVAGGGSLWKVVSEPMVGATILGAIFLWQDWQAPTFITNTLELIGQMAIPLMLITLGVAVARLTPGGIGRAILLSLAKLALCVAIAWGTGLWFDLDRIAFGVLVLQCATPVAVTSYLLAAKLGADADSVAGLVVVSTLLSVVALPILLSQLL